VIFLGTTRNENKEAKQDSFLMFWCCFCCFLLFCLSCFFLWIFLDSSCESICLCSFWQKQKTKKPMQLIGFARESKCHYNTMLIILACLYLVLTFGDP
jgi:hypothetical protein